MAVAAVAVPQRTATVIVNTKARNIAPALYHFVIAGWRAKIGQEMGNLWQKSVSSHIQSNPFACS
jgi:hypothetical protein